MIRFEKYACSEALWSEMNGHNASEHAYLDVDSLTRLLAKFLICGISLTAVVKPESESRHLGEGDLRAASDTRTQNRETDTFFSDIQERETNFSKISTL